MEDFKKFKEDKEKPIETLVENVEGRKAIQKFLMEKNGLSDNGLVALVMLYNSGVLKEDYKEELEFFEYVKFNSVTEKGKAFLNDPKTVETLRQMIEE